MAEPKITSGEAWYRIKAHRSRIRRPIKYSDIQQWARDESENEARQILTDAMIISRVMQGEAP